MLISSWVESMSIAVAKPGWHGRKHYNYLISLKYRQSYVDKITNNYSKLFLKIAVMKSLKNAH